MPLVLQMPDRGVATQTLEPEEVDAAAPERSGYLGGITLGAPLWRGQWGLSRNLTREASDEWRAFFARLRRSGRGFFAWDRERPFPKAHRQGFERMTTAGGAPFTGSASGWSQTIDSDGNAMLELTGLPSGLSLGLGDYIGFRWDASGSAAGTHDRRTMVRCVGTATANASGVALVMVEPAVPVLVVPSGAQAHLDRPGCIMRLVPGESALAPMDNRTKIGGGTINAVQDLRA